jgi:hypothetical protein
MTNKGASKALKSQATLFVVARADLGISSGRCCQSKLPNLHHLTSLFPRRKSAA